MPLAGARGPVHSVLIIFWECNLLLTTILTSNITAIVPYFLLIFIDAHQNSHENGKQDFLVVLHVRSRVFVEVVPPLLLHMPWGISRVFLEVDPSFILDDSQDSI